MTDATSMLVLVLYAIMGLTSLRLLALEVSPWVPKRRALLGRALEDRQASESYRRVLAYTVATLSWLVLTLILQLGFRSWPRVPGAMCAFGFFRREPLPLLAFWTATFATTFGLQQGSPAWNKVRHALAIAGAVVCGIYAWRVFTVDASVASSCCASAAVAEQIRGAAGGRYAQATWLMVVLAFVLVTLFSGWAARGRTPEWPARTTLSVALLGTLATPYVLQHFIAPHVLANALDRCAYCALREAPSLWALAMCLPVLLVSLFGVGARARWVCASLAAFAVASLLAYHPLAYRYAHHVWVFAR